MAQTHIGRLKAELERAAGALRDFEEFRSPFSQPVVSAVWAAAQQGSLPVVRVAVREDHGVFYRGQIVKPSRKGNWEVLADDGELVPEVTADMFVSVRMIAAS
jgi:hypothetical protein